jgi:peptidyl-dipeptidase Dcp
MTDSPLLAPSALPNGAPPFDRIDTGHYLPAITDGIARARARVEEIKADPAPADFANTIVALETAGEDLEQATSVFYNQLAAVGGDEMHALAAQIGPLLAAFSSDISLDPAVFARVKAVWDGHDPAALTPEEATLLDEAYQGFVRAGALLDDAGKARLREIDAQLSTLGPAFSQNVVKATEAFALHLTHADEVAGLPDSALRAARAAAADRGLEGWCITLEGPVVQPFLQFADRRDLRERVWRAYASRGSGPEADNAPLIRQMVALRAERARLLGYVHHADYVLARRMAGSARAVADFLATLKGAYKPAAERELAELADFAGLQRLALTTHNPPQPPPCSQGGDSDSPSSERGGQGGGARGCLMPWDTGYWAEKLRQHTFAFSSEDLRPYFPLGTVLRGVFDHFSALFGLRFEAADGQYPTWHPDVQVFDVYDDRGFAGTLYADFHPRTGKQDGAWKTTYRNQGLFRGRVERPVVAIVCNFTKPTPGAPSLLTHREVETLLHEMGHAVHALLSRVTYQSLAGTSVRRDFVELPSQIQENWAYTRPALDRMSGHYETGAKIPDALLDKLRAARTFMAGGAGLRQVHFATLDMAWHTLDAAPDDIGAFEDAAGADTALFPRLAGPFSAAFGHIFGGGYAAGYYGYKWAEVLDADAFGAFEAAGVYDAATAQRFKTEILERGGSEPPEVLYRRFRGRDADPAALLRREGV